jgi:hypothetical protein
MANDTFLYWGMVVTAFLLIACILTARQLLENYLLDRADRLRKEEKAREIANSNSGL